jgi:hypothetical protein
MARKLRVQYEGASYHVMSRACCSGDILWSRRTGMKIKIARHLRQETAMTWAWIAEQVVMGAKGHAANRVREAK